MDSVNDGLGLTERDRDFLLILSLRVPKRDRLGEEGDVMVVDEGCGVRWCGGLMVLWLRGQNSMEERRSKSQKD